MYVWWEWMERNIKMINKWELFSPVIEHVSCEEDVSERSQLPAQMEDVLSEVCGLVSAKQAGGWGSDWLADKRRVWSAQLWSKRSSSIFLHQMNTFHTHWCFLKRMWDTCLTEINVRFFFRLLIRLIKLDDTELTHFTQNNFYLLQKNNPIMWVLILQHESWLWSKKKKEKAILYFYYIIFFKVLHNVRYLKAAKRTWAKEEKYIQTNKYVLFFNFFLHNFKNLFSYWETEDICKTLKLKKYKLKWDEKIKNWVDNYNINKNWS